MVWKVSVILKVYSFTGKVGFDLKISMSLKR